MGVPQSDDERAEEDGQGGESGAETLDDIPDVDTQAEEAEEEAIAEYNDEIMEGAFAEYNPFGHDHHNGHDYPNDAEVAGGKEEESEPEGGHDVDITTVSDEVMRQILNRASLQVFKTSCAAELQKVLDECVVDIGDDMGGEPADQKANKNNKKTAMMNKRKKWNTKKKVKKALQMMRRHRESIKRLKKMMQQRQNREYQISVTAECAE